MKKFILAAAAAGTLASVPAMAAPVSQTGPAALTAYGLSHEAPTAHQYRRGYDNDYQRRGYGQNYQYNDRYNNRYNDRYARNARNNNRGWNGQSWRGNDGRTYCRRDNGTTGLLIGGAAGALAGSEIAGRRDGTIGAIIGGIGGALLGRTIDRNSGSGYNCR